LFFSLVRKTLGSPSIISPAPTIREEYVTPKELPAVLNTALAQAPDLMRQHITDPLWSGEMLSKELQKKRIRCHCKSKTAKYKK